MWPHNSKSLGIPKCLTPKSAGIYEDLCLAFARTEILMSQPMRRNRIGSNEADCMPLGRSPKADHC